ncbi:unnamed protein product [Nezara viridula]|uniref:Uncharacterized protein n=1 Tax=Nezara viridula TaxID=85310 RepID=A0A9P0EAC5_NEZVI|nr:unnamed protein product [Nezara viridula]
MSIHHLRWYPRHTIQFMLSHGPRSSLSCLSRNSGLGLSSRILLGNSELNRAKEEVSRRERSPAKQMVGASSP